MWSLSTCTESTYRLLHEIEIMAKKQVTRKTANKNKTKDGNVNLKSIFSPEDGWKELLRGEKLKFILGLITFALA